MKEMKITIKQHYIPKVYLKHFNNQDSPKGDIYIFFHKRNDSSKVEVILEGQKEISEIFYKQFIYTNINAYFEVLEGIKTELKEEYNLYVNNEKKKENINKFKKEVKKVLDNFINETEPKLREELEKQVEKQGKNPNDQSIREEIENKIKQRNESVYDQINFLPILLTEISMEKYLKNVIEKIDSFLSKIKKWVKIEAIEELKEFSNLFYQFFEELTNMLNDIKTKLGDANNKVKENTKNDATYLKDNKKYAKNLNDVIYKQLRIINIDQLRLKIKSFNENSKILLENLLGKFENSCIFNKKEIYSKNDYIKETFKDDFKFRIIKYILIQFYRMPDFNNKISEENLDCLKAILEETNYKSLKKKNKLELLNFNALLIEVEQKIFCTSDNPILYNEKSGILIFPLTPKIVFIIEKNSHNNLNKNILNLKYGEHQSFIKNINYLILKNSHKNIVSAVENIQFEEIALDDFIRKYKFILKKYNLISQQKYI